MELHDGAAGLEAAVGRGVLAEVVALGGAVPEEEAAVECCSRSLGACRDMAGWSGEEALTDLHGIRPLLAVVLLTCLWDAISVHSLLAGGEEARAYPHAVPEDHEPVAGGRLGRRREEEHRGRESEKQRWAPSPAPLRWHHFFGIDGSGRTAFGRVASWWRTRAGVEAWRDSALIGFVGGRRRPAVSVEI